MANRKLNVDWLRTLGAPEDPVATDTSSAWSAMSLLKAVFGGIENFNADLLAHLADAADAHDASAISIADAGGNYVATDAEAALAEVMDALQAHEADTADAHDASAVSFSPAGSIAATTVQAALAELDSEKQPLDAGLTDIAALAVTDGNIIVGDGTNWVAESGATARTSLGVGTGDSPAFTSATLTAGLRVGFAGAPTADRIELGDASAFLDFGNIIAATLMIFGDSGDSLRYDRTNNVWAFAIGNNDAVYLDRPAVATETALRIYDVDNNAIERVTVGAAGSGGVGFKLLRIPN